MSVAFSELNVKAVVPTAASRSRGRASQMSIEDVALMTSLPGFVVMVPSDEISARALVFETRNISARLYSDRPSKAPVVHKAGTDFKIG